MLDQILYDSYTRYFMFKVGILDTGFDRVKGSCNGNRGNGSCDGCDEVLGPRCLGVIGYTKDIFFCCSRCAKELRRR